MYETASTSLISSPSIPAVANGAAGKDEAAMRESAEKFEQAFLSAMLQPVFKSISENTTFGGGFAEETWTGLLTQEYAASIGKSSNLGIAESVYQDMLRLNQDAASTAKQKEI